MRGEASWDRGGVKKGTGGKEKGRTGGEKRKGRVCGPNFSS